MSNTANSTIEERALALLGNGIDPVIVASSLGVTPARISQLTGQEEFAAQLSALRYEKLSKHNAHDDALDALEGEFLKKLDETKELLFRPEQVLKAIQILNSAKRRGTSAPEAITQANPVVSITMPVKIINRFTTNIMNQVIEAGNQTLVTVQSGSLLDKIKKSQANRENSLVLENGVTQGEQHGPIRTETSRSATIPAQFEPQARSGVASGNAIPAFATSE